MGARGGECLLIAIVDFGAGNLRSVANALEAIGQAPLVASDPEMLRDATAIVLPGVGAFGEGFRRLQELGMVEALNEQVRGAGKPFLGICLGMQFLAEVGEEHGRSAGLGWIGGTVRKMTSDDRSIRIPHMGWNEIELARESPLFAGLDEQCAFYFLHGYHFDVADSSADAVVARCEHGRPYVAAVAADNVYGVQFHPEKSQLAGLRLLKNFVDIAR